MIGSKDRKTKIQPNSGLKIHLLKTVTETTLSHNGLIQKLKEQQEYWISILFKNYSENDESLAGVTGVIWSPAPTLKLSSESWAFWSKTPVTKFFARYLNPGSFWESWMWIFLEIFIFDSFQPNYIKLAETVNNIEGNLWN